MKTASKAIRMVLVLFIICGLIYPLVMTGISQTFFRNQANGSIISSNGTEVGSALLGQDFTNPGYFHGRISSVNYNTYNKGDKVPLVSSGSSNLAASNPELTKRVEKDVNEFLKANPGIKKSDLPADLFTASGSGLDPDISPAAAKVEIPGISKSTGISISDLQSIADKCTERRTLGIFGEPRVNVLKANLAVKNRLK